MKSFFEWVGVTLITSFIIGASAAVGTVLLHAMVGTVCGG